MHPLTEAPQPLHHHSQLPQRTPLIIKPSLVDLINKHRISMIHLSQAARVQLGTVQAITLRNEPVQPVIAMQILDGVEALTGHRYTLTDIDLPVQPYRSHQ